MKIKLFCLILISVLGFHLTSYAQEIRSGTRSNRQTNVKEAISYVVITSSNNNVFFNHYSIFRKVKTAKADTLLTVDLNFDKTNNSIKINHFDWVTNQYNSETILFQPLSAQIRKSTVMPIYCVKNYKFNDTLLSMTKDDNASILFTIADTISPSIFLHQFTTIDGNYRFDLDKFRKSYLNPHLSHSKNYWEWYNSVLLTSNREIAKKQKSLDSAYRAKYAALQIDINQELLKIKDDKDSLLSTLSEKQQSFKLQDTIASEKAQELFTHRMDKLFSEYLSETHCINAEIAGTYKFYVNPNQSINIIKQPPVFLTNWWCAQQFDRIDTLVKHIQLENTVISVCDDDPYLVIYKNHLNRSNNLMRDITNMKFKADSVFKPTLNSAQSELKDFCNKKVSLTTAYTYPFKYTSKSEWKKWMVRNKKFIDSEKNLIDNQKNIDQFTKLYPKVKNGKYNVRMNTTLVNDKTYGPDIDSVSLKYKFRTRVGFSIGTFAPEGQITAGGDTTSGEIFIWNVSFIYHHIGLFAGSTSSYGKSAMPQSKDNHTAVTYLKNYSEGGILISPGKFLYFKLGVAKYSTINKNESGTLINESKSIINPLAGISLMFPVFQLEGGYNFALKYPYVMAGFNIPINF